MEAGGIAGDRLKSLVERYEHLQEEIDALNDDRSELMKEVAGAGFDKKIFKLVIKRRRMGQDQCDEEDTLVELYERALLTTMGNAENSEASRAHARETSGSPAIRRAVQDFVRNVPEDTTVSITTAEGQGFAVTNTGGRRTVRQFGATDEAPGP